ncbi:sterile alpha motif domain-containing protein 11 isoform X1 [Corapipo altera]|uniref:sterile alpha motif domain-containing protein 11 isoform X1 n=2 Tax=Corapipo altera TaxID=415028 RepID=UPI000FD64ECC|nr:sterile alpha motif domain-containing protein 11 isoform X1 [Corapipo altera]XP_027513900.1 sterile alpha motif domain-containing protein 11 isoform X1 [Corapipo altera]XP_027513902.1 sterile alpha motif domain-containing protein 11 isoform X1 [Corapipo altera]XP_027513903.1 sterile alpha motif domain-containing protein 11 isoform X1 [Corapipo altera]
MSGISPEGQICEPHSSSRVYGTLASPWERDPRQLCWGASPGDLLAGCSGGYQPPPAPERQRCLCCCCCCCWRISSKLQPERGQVEPETLEPLCFGETRAHGERSGTMPAIKKERLDREEMALAAFNQPMETLPDYLAPLAAAAIPVVTPHPPAYDQIFAHRAYLGFHETHHPHPHHPHHPHHLPEDLMLERFSSIPDFQPFFDNGEPCIEVECGENKALLYINKLCQGSKGPSIRYRGEWLTPNEFQFVSGRETAKDWKRSIRHKGKSLKTLMSKGILQVHPPICDCPGCRISSPVNRGRLAEKRTIPLPPTRIPKKELTSIFSHSDDSEESDKSNGQHPEVKQEEDLHISIMKRRIHTHWDLNISFRETSCSRDNDLSTIISNLHQSRQLVMPETQSRCEFKRNSIEVGLGAADEILGKRRVCSPNSSSECPLESKKARSESPKENSHTPLLEDSVTQMTPEEHYRRMMSALNEHGTFEEQQQQRLYQLANSMAVPSHGDLLRARQEVAAAAAARNPGAMEAHIPSASNSSSQRRKQGLPQHRDTHFPEREISHPPPLLSPQNAPHIALGPHLRPPFLGVPSALCQTPGYGFLQPAQAEMFARQQEMLRKQNLARLEMSAEIIRQKELENLHRQRLLAGDPLSLHPGLPPDHPALRNVHDIPEGHPLREELSRRNAMLVLRHNNTPLLSLNPAVPGASSSTPPKEQPRRGSRKTAGQHRAEPQGVGEAKEPAEPRARDGAPDCNDEEMKDSESDADVSDEKPESLKAEGGGGSAAELKECKEAGKACEGAKEMGEAGAAQNAPCSSSSAESPSHLLGPGINKAEVKYLPPASIPPPQPLPFGFPYTMSPYFHAGTMGGLFLDGEESPALEDISKWTVEDVCSFVSNLSGCTEYTQVFREQAIDGETLPLLTEEHLLNNMGLKLGPALKIRSQVAKRVGRVLYMAGFPMAFPLQPPGLRPPERDVPAAELRPASTGSVASPFGSGVPSSASRGSPKQENGNPSLLPGLNDTTKPPS